MITALLIVLLCVMASAKITVQGTFAKKIVRNQADAMLYNGMIFCACALLYLPGLLTSPVSWTSVLFGAAMGLLSVVFQWTYIQAMSSGTVSLTVLINNFAMLMPILVSAFVYGEPFGFTRILGTVLMIVSCAMDVKLDKGEKTDKRWLVLTFFTFLSNGMIAVVQKVFTKTAHAAEISGFVGSSYIMATLAAALFLWFFAKRGIRRSFAIRPAIPLSAVAVGILLSAFQAVNTYANTRIDGTLLFPTYNGGVTLALAVIGMVFFREKLSDRKKLGLLVGIIAIVLMSIS